LKSQLALCYSIALNEESDKNKNNKRVMKMAIKRLKYEVKYFEIPVAAML